MQGDPSPNSPTRYTALFPVVSLRTFPQRASGRLKKLNAN